MNPDVAAAVERLSSEGVLSPARAGFFGRVARRQLVSVRLEIRAALYAGVLLVTSGVGLFLKENHERIGPAAIGFTVALAAAACLAWASRRSAPFTWEESAPVHAAFDYVLLLGALLVAADIGYLEAQLGLFGSNWPWHLVLVAALYLFLAYRFDSRMLLSLALTALAAWRGIAVRLETASLGTGDPARLRAEAVVLGALFAALGVASARGRKKAHFEDVYVNAGLLLAFGGLLSGVFVGREASWGGWLLALLLAAAAVAAASFRAKRALPFALGVVAAWLGLQRLVVEGAGREPAGALLLSAITAAAALFLIVSVHRKMRVR